MANYAGLSSGEELYCGTNIQPYLTSTGQLTGKTCTSVFASGAVSGLVLNGATVGITDGNTLDMVIKTVSGTLTNACFVCSCKTCLDPDGNAQRATYSGQTINPESPYTLIGMGFLQS
tara:strand:+ start:1030 stop:1383 length:354 start_codon:yes stop_codon:yes gene_type:complete